MLPNDPLCNVLHVDLSRKSYHVEQRRDLFERYLGGSGVATRLLMEECPEGIDALDPQNPIILTVGPLTGLYSLASKTVAMFKSPHTGNLGESHAGGRSAVAIRLAGYGAIVIKGASDLPVYFSVEDGHVRFKDATTIWGLSSVTAGRIMRENEGGAGLRTIMRIGRAGEQLMPYANVMIETYRHFGRLGLGAVFGSKKLKGLVVTGKHSLPVADKRAYIKTYDTIYQAATTSTKMQKYHDLGTPSNVLSLDAIGGLPTRNLQATRFEGVRNLSGEALAEGYLGRRLACAHCPVGCIHIAAIREPYADVPYFFKTTMVPYDYEPIFALGSMLGISDTVGFLKLLDRIDAYGMDSMSSGVVLAWATEALEKKLVTTEHTMGLKLAWGDAKTYLKAAEYLLEQPNDFYRALARGVDHASSIYGGKEFALAFGHNEMAGYHTGPAAHLGLLFGTRHSHLDNAGYSLDQKVLNYKDVAPKDLVDRLIEEEAWRQILGSLVVCFFARGIYTIDLVRECLAVAGFEVTEEQLLALGTEMWVDKYRYKLREGFQLGETKLPQRIFRTASALGTLDESYMQECIAYFQTVVEKALAIEPA